MHDEGAKSMMLHMARDYDEIAARVEKRINEARHQPGG
jgi:hypothetical protein